MRYQGNEWMVGDEGVPKVFAEGRGASGALRGLRSRVRAHLGRRGLGLLQQAVVGHEGGAELKGDIGA